MPNNPRITRVHWNPRMSSKRLNELLNTPNIHEDDEDAIMGELWLRDDLSLSGITSEEFAQLQNLPNGEPLDLDGYCQMGGR